MFVLVQKEHSASCIGDAWESVISQNVENIRVKKQENFCLLLKKDRKLYHY